MLSQFRAYCDRRPLVKHFIKFCVVGGTSALLNFIIYYTLINWLQLWAVVAGGWAYLVSAIFNFISNKFWTFRNPLQGRQMAMQVARFAAVMGGGLLLNTLLIYLQIERFKVDYRLAWVVANGLVIFWNFSFNRYWTFKAHRPTRAELPGPTP